MYAVNRLWFLVGRWQWGSRVGFRGDGEAVEVPIYPSDTPENDSGADVGDRF